MIGNTVGRLMWKSVGTVRMTKMGAIRWTSFSIYHGEERWRSEGVQVGGLRSARGILGTWFDKCVFSCLLLGLCCPNFLDIASHVSALPSFYHVYVLMCLHYLGTTISTAQQAPQHSGNSAMSLLKINLRRKRRASR